MNEEFLINLNTYKITDIYTSKEYIIDYIDYMLEIIAKTNHDLKDMYIDILKSYKKLEHDTIVKKIRPIEVIFHDYELATYGVYRRAKVINREIMIKYIEYLKTILELKNNILDEPILDALNIYTKYKHFETIVEKLKPIEKYLNTSLDIYQKIKS